jgi:hypothetical protein
MKDLIEYTNKRLITWFENAKIDFGVIGSGSAKIEGSRFIVETIENGESNEWSAYFHESYLSHGLDYFFDCWMEGA